MEMFLIYKAINSYWVSREREKARNKVIKQKYSGTNFFFFSWDSHYQIFKIFYSLFYPWLMHMYNFLQFYKDKIGMTLY